MDLEIVILSEVSQTKTNIIWYHLYVESKKMVQMNLCTKQNLITNTWQDVQYYSLLENCKSKLQWDTTLHQPEWPSSRSLQTINAEEVVEKRKRSHAVGGTINWYSHYERWYGDSLKNRNKTTIWPSSPTPRHIPWRNQNWKRHMYPMLHCSTTYKSWNMEPGCPSTDEWIKKLRYIYTMEYYSP